MAITTRIKEARTEKGVTQKQIAEATGVDVHQLSRYENGHQIPTVESLHKIAAFLGVKMEDLIIKEGEDK